MNDVPHPLRRAEDYMNDHDLIIQIHTIVTRQTEDIKDLKTSLNESRVDPETVSDHERRIRRLECVTTYGLGALGVLQFLVMIYVAIKYH
jgi:hypothetical protein